MKNRRSEQHFYKCTRSQGVRSNRLKRGAGTPNTSLRAVIAIGGLLCLTHMTPASAATDIDNLKLYAHSRIVNYEQFQCFNKIITQESRWSVTARNGSHYGLGQMRSKHYRDLDGFRQIDASIKYIKIRYKSMCNGYRFMTKHGYH